MPTRPTKTIFVVSDSSGETGSRAARAALELFSKQHVTERRYPGVKTASDIHDIVCEAAQCGGLVLYTFADKGQQETMQHVAEQCHVAAVNLFKELIPSLEQWLRAEAAHEPSHREDVDRLRALEFFRQQEDGRNPEGMLQAEFVIAGLSRVTKTPVCMQLAHNGKLAANVPLAVGVAPPVQLFQVPARKVFVLMMPATQLRKYRMSRIKNLGLDESSSYVDLKAIGREIEFVSELTRANPAWRVLDVSQSLVEETAARIMQLSQS